ncbi:MAG TPA: ABC transporter ATP-binding protein [Lacipirellulaceae bacterium]|jgi:ATP-binding cassette subfamily B protein/subfamily B ATP-binding cassette protein MsbA|nr:ABC transporter ATP-binding protein [Lacipirellulaceae bacterium]
MSRNGEFKFPASRTGGAAVVFSLISRDSNRSMQKPTVSSRQQFEQYRSELFSRNGHAHERHRRDRTAGMLIWSFLRLVNGRRGALAFALATLSVATLLSLVPPAATKFVVDYVLTAKPLPAAVPDWVPREPWPLLVTITAGVLLVSVFKTAIHIWGRWHATRVTKLLQMSIRKQVFAHVVRMPLHRVQELKSGGAASILRQDAGSVGELIFGMLYNPWRAMIQLFGSLCILAWVDWKLLVGAIVAVPLIYLTHRTWISRIRPQHRRIRAERERVDALATEAFGGMRVVRAFGRHRSETTRIMRGNHVMGRQELYAWWWMRAIEIVWETIIPLASALLLMYGGWQVIQGGLTLGDLVMFLVYLLMLLGPLAVLAQSAAEFQNGLSGLDRILDLLEEPREMESSSAVKVSRAASEGRITFDDVSFSYPGSSTFALENISLDVEPGETIALVGPSGSGKTTLCNLVGRFYDPTSGRILLDGRDLGDLEIDSYRSLIGIVEQDVFLFDGTIAANIAYGNRHATDQDVREAAAVASAHEFIEALPNGYETLIGERGVRLSGGQRQRIAIARAVLADPKILILDEATSNLDTESERTIQRSLTALMENRTCFVIAHRLSTITHADRIVVLDRGRIREIGSHEALMAAGGRYCEMVKLQTRLALV